MSIEWFSAKPKEGIVSFYATNITLNAVAMQPFERAAYVQVGVDERKRVVLKPITLEMLDKHQAEDVGLFPIASKASYARVSSTALCAFLSEKLGIAFGKSPVKGKSHFLEGVGLLVEVGEGE